MQYLANVQQYGELIDIIFESWASLPSGSSLFSFRTISRFHTPYLPWFRSLPINIKYISKAKQPLEVPKTLSILRFFILSPNYLSSFIYHPLDVWSTHSHHNLARPSSFLFCVRQSQLHFRTATHTVASTENVFLLALPFTWLHDLKLQHLPQMSYFLWLRRR